MAATCREVACPFQCAMRFSLVGNLCFHDGFFLSNIVLNFLARALKQDKEIRKEIVKLIIFADDINIYMLTKIIRVNEHIYVYLYPYIKYSAKLQETRETNENQCISIHWQ